VAEIKEAKKRGYDSRVKPLANRGA